MKQIIMMLALIAMPFVGVKAMGDKPVEQEKSVFRFEDYAIKGNNKKSSELIKNALLERHPVGSPVQGLLKTLESTVPVCKVEKSTNNKGEVSKENSLYYRCITSHFITTKDWIIKIKQVDGFIHNLNVTIYYTGP